MLWQWGSGSALSVILKWIMWHSGKVTHHIKINTELSEPDVPLLPLT